MLYRVQGRIMELQGHKVFSFTICVVGKKMATLQVFMVCVSMCSFVIDTVLKFFPLPY